jgi:hypothetical protein
VDETTQRLKPRHLKLISASVTDIEDAVEATLDEWVPIGWHFTERASGTWAHVVCASKLDVMRAQAAKAPPANWLPPGIRRG